MPAYVSPAGQIIWSDFGRRSSFRQIQGEGPNGINGRGDTEFVDPADNLCPLGILDCFPQRRARGRNDEIRLLRQTCAVVQSAAICCSSRSGGALPSLSWPA
ncbi:MAG: hypothetical protein U0938_07805, partial [Thiobacillus sp.]|nr:hypothetical protein [Thiobacillus sp.]